jgi:FtsH-binding integral membrane protein
MAERDYEGARFEARTRERAVATERLDFIRKVYSLFFVGILLCAGGVYLSYTNPAIFFKARYGLWIGALLLLVISFFSDTLRRKSPWNMMLLVGVTSMLGMACGPAFFMIEAAGKGVVLLQAFILTTGVFGGLTAYAWLSKKDFSFLGGFLTVGIIGLILASIVYMFIPGATGLGFAIACVGVLIFAGFILYDTSNILHRYDTGEYVAGALDLFLDFFNMFWYLVRILLASRD